MEQDPRFFDEHCYQKYSCLVIDEQAIAHNVAQLHQRTGGRLIAVVKENGYGLGLRRFYEILKGQGVDFFAVTGTDEALTLRRLGCREDILMLTPILDREELAALHREGVALTLHSLEQAALFRQLAQQSGTPVRVHIKLDTGMGRYGFDWRQVPDLAPFGGELVWEGCYTHLAGRPQKYAQQVAEQAARFQKGLDALAAQGIRPGLRHIANSAALMALGDLGYDAVRVGSALIGKCYPRQGLREAVWLEAPVAMLLDKKKGDTISYESQAVLKRDSRLALLRIGHCDGVGLSFTGVEAGFVRQILKAAKRAVFPGRYVSTITIGGKPYPVLGELGIAHMIVDVTDSPVQVGDMARVSVNPLMVQAFVPRRTLQSGE